MIKCPENDKKCENYYMLALCAVFVNLQLISQSINIEHLENLETNTQPAKTRSFSSKGMQRFYQNKDKMFKTFDSRTQFLYKAWMYALLENKFPQCLKERI